MSKIVINVSKLPIADKIVKGQDFITKWTDNPNVPGNATLLSGLSAAQDELTTANNAEVAGRSALAALMSARVTALESWDSAVNLLASFTESATGGDAESIESAGFAVRVRRTPPQALPAPTKVVANLNRTPGHTLLSWEVIAGAKSYVIQISPDPMTGTSWTYACACTTANADVNGAEPGKRYWYRIAAVNAKGQGPWSEPVCRPVM